MTSGCLARLHCVLSLREETQDADKEALPVQPNRHRKASAEERLDTVPKLKNTMGRVWGQTPPTPALCSLWVVLFIVRVQQREPACLCRRRKQQVGSGKAFFRSVQQTCFADRSSQSWKGINEWKGYLSFPPGNKLPGSPGTSKMLCQAPALKHCSTKPSSVWGGG